MKSTPGTKAVHRQLSLPLSGALETLQEKKNCVYEDEPFNIII